MGKKSHRRCAKSTECDATLRSLRDLAYALGDEWATALGGPERSPNDTCFNAKVLQCTLGVLADFQYDGTTSVHTNVMRLGSLLKEAADGTMDQIPSLDAVGEMHLQSIVEILGGQRLTPLGFCKAVTMLNMPDMPGLHGCTRVDDSDVHGKGLFACRDFKKGELMTLYAIDVLKVSLKPIGMLTCSSIRRFNDSDSVPPVDAWDTSLDMILDLSHSDVKLYGAPDPLLPTRADALAHYANASVASNSLLHMKQAVVSGRQNGVFGPILCGAVTAVFATRDIARGEEILITYGPSYKWGN